MGILVPRTVKGSLLSKKIKYKEDVKQWAECFLIVIERDAKVKDYDAKDYKRHIINKIQELINREVK